MEDPYAILGVDRKATPDAIKKAYRRLAKELHPDLHPGDSKIEDRFKQVSAAYGLLSDPELRAKFDRGEIDASGQERVDPRFYRAYAGQGDGKYHTRFGGDFSASDMFSDLFGGNGGRVRMGGQDARYTVTVGFMEAARGATKRLTLPDGKTLDVNIPEGIEDGQTIRLRGQGGAGLGGGRPGDALVEVSVQSHPQFKRDGANVTLDLPITLPEAVLGGKIAVPTVHGTVTMTVPKGTHSGDTLRLRGKGIKDRKTGRNGDQLVRLLIKLPPSGDADLEAFIKEWARTHPYSVRDTE